MPISQLHSASRALASYFDLALRAISNLRSTGGLRTPPWSPTVGANSIPGTPSGDGEGRVRNALSPTTEWRSNNSTGKTYKLTSRSIASRVGTKRQICTTPELSPQWLRSQLSVSTKHPVLGRVDTVEQERSWWNAGDRQARVRG